MFPRLSLEPRQRHGRRSRDDAASVRGGGHDVTFTNSVGALRDLEAKTITREYTQLKEISDDVDDARVYGGIHFRFDQEDGNVLGRAVATEIYKNYLRPVHP